MTQPSPDEALREFQRLLPTDFELYAYVDGGGQGKVFRGTVGGQAAAIKIFDPSGDPRRFKRELALLKSVSCPFLVKVLRDTVVRDGSTSYPVIAYEFHQGGDLRRLLLPHAPAASAASICKLGLQMSEAIQALWEKRIVHRDIKPGNIVEATGGNFVLVDVGLARHLDRSDITALGGAPGTSGYKSPEQAAGRRHLTINSDVFSLGVTLYELACKRHPFGRSQQVIGRTTPQPLGKTRGDIPRDAARLIHQMLSTSPGDRPRFIANRFRELCAE